MTTLRNPEVRVTRRFEASAERVFDDWLNPRLAAKWLFKSTEGEDVTVTIDARFGGQWSVVAHRADGDMRHSGEYLVMERPTKLVFTFAVLQLSPEYDLVTVIIRPLDKGCELTLLNEMKPDNFAEWGEKTKEGWTQILDGLAAAVGG